MAKSRKNNSVFKSITSATGKALPVVNSGLNTVGKVAKGVTYKTIPIINEGVSTVYGTMSNGLDLGVRGVKTVARGLNLKTQKKRSRRSNKRSNKRSHKRRH
jgi:hypothetical protein